MNVRRLGPGDETAALEILSWLGEAPPPAKHLAAFLASPDTHLIAAFGAGGPVGFLLAYRLPRLAGGSLVYLYDVLVLPGRRRRGIATAMVKALKDLCRGTGVVEIWVGSGRSNRAACALWEATGAERVSEEYVEFVFHPGSF